MEYIFPFLSLIISFLIVKFLKDYLLKKNVMDIPNERSSHTVPTPRGGGVGISISIVSLGLIYSFLIKDYRISLFFIISGAMALVGWIDDKKGGLHTALTFIIQITLASFVLLIFGFMEKFPLPSPFNFELGYFAFPLSLIWIVGITNIYNFLDGIDGYAGSQGVIAGLGWYLIMGNEPSGMIGLIVAGACLGFLFLNWNPAKIFMGDVGSAFLGFVIACFPFIYENYAVKTSSYPFYVLVLLLWFFLSDGTFTMIRRLLKKEKIWQPHRSHLYQRLTIAGWKHSKVTILMIIFSFINFISLILVTDFNFLNLGLALLLFIIFLVITINSEKKIRN